MKTPGKKFFFFFQLHLQEVNQRQPALSEVPDLKLVVNATPQQ